VALYSSSGFGEAISKGLSESLLDLKGIGLPRQAKRDSFILKGEARAKKFVGQVFYLSVSHIFSEKNASKTRLF